MGCFNLTQLLFAVSFAAILFSLFTAEGCGFRYATVSAIAMAPDSRSMAVVRHDARQGLGKAFSLNDIRRTISVVQLPPRRRWRVVVRDPKPGVTASDIILYGSGQKDFVAFGPPRGE